MPATVPPRLTGSCPLPVKIYFQAQKPMVLLPSLSPSMSFPGSQTYPFCPALPWCGAWRVQWLRWRFPPRCPSSNPPASFFFKLKNVHVENQPAGLQVPRSRQGCSRPHRTCWTPSFFSKSFSVSKISLDLLLDFSVSIICICSLP